MKIEELFPLLHLCIDAVHLDTIVSSFVYNSHSWSSTLNPLFTTVLIITNLTTRSYYHLCIYMDEPFQNCYNMSAVNNMNMYLETGRLSVVVPSKHINAVFED